MGTLLFQQLVQTMLSATLLSTAPEPRTSHATWIEPGGIATRLSPGTIALRIRDLGEEVPRRVAEDSLIFELVGTIERGDCELALTINTGGDAPWKAPEWTAPLVEQMQQTPRVPITVTANVTYRF